MSNSCPICIKVVLNSEDGVCCDGTCERWFHRECLKMPKAEYQRISSDTRIKWQCTRTDCGKATSDSVSNKLDEILSKLSSLATKVELADGLKSIKEDLDKVTAKLEEFEPRLNKVEAEVSTIKNKHLVNNDQILEDFISEQNDRSRRSRNVIVHNLPELSNSPNLAASKAHDANLIECLLGHINSSVPPSDIRHFRLGRGSRDKPRPLVVCMPSESAAIHVFKNFRKDDVPNNLKNISLSHDRTLRERKHLEQLRATLKSRQDAGESNLTIKFVNGVPTIVSKNA